MDQPFDDQQWTTAAEVGPGRAFQAAIAPKAARSGWRSSLAMVGLCWFAVAVVALSLYSGALLHLVARGSEPIVAIAGNAVAVPDDPGNEAGSVLCRDVTRADATRLNRGFTLMRRTREGSQLYQELVDKDVCVTVRDLTYFAGLAIPRRQFGGWGHSTIEIDRDHLDTAGSDVLASTLVHEATHIDRSIQGTTCVDHDDCTVLDNGVVLEEEVAAHAAEARWWLATYGRSGKEDPDLYAAWENQLAAAYLAGAKTFEAYVESFRSDPEEAGSR
jgi:hypothetical protein